LTPKDVTTVGKDAIKHQLAISIFSDAAGNFGISTGAGNGSAELLGGDTPATRIMLSANPTLAINQIKEAANLTRAAAYNLTLDAVVGANPEGKITIVAKSASDTADYVIGADDDFAANRIYNTDVLKLTIDGDMVTTSLTDSGLNDTDEAYTTTTNLITEALENRWNAVYGTTGGTSYSESLYLVDETSSGVLAISAKSGSGRRGYDKSYSIAVSASAHTPTLSAYYGETTASSDNKTASDDIIVLVGSTRGGSVLDTADLISITGLASNVVSVLTTTLLLNDEANTSTAKNIYPLEARGDGAKGAGGDAILPEGDVAEVATPAVSFSRVHWL